MKTYKEFVTESNQSKLIVENPWGTAFNILRGGSKAGYWTQGANLVTAGLGLKRGIESIRDKDEFGIYNAAAQALPATNPYTAAFKLGAIGVDRMRLKKLEDERKKNGEKAKLEILRK